ncbi:Mth938-like domain-containing protein [Oleiagrimonas soli]|uniref:Mth938-like domain-containing protein n=1 Tax=Oleiagrimonas soli TaxID=1543381 RepID=A0A099CWJ4_9GAMM|nr:Mth938-like domain-containing protein [Oleiagrimonas soli]KGI78114.1 hypothetical protein LF63_0107105 [Oleiagrimonas soli]MBB6183448.1 uncharacterized protein [Oleiagrimonas soli]
MELSLERPEDFLYVRRVEDDAVTIVDRRFTRSLVLARDQVIEDWPVRDAKSLQPDDVQAILALKPEVVLLGTGTRQQFPNAATLGAFTRKNVGVEVMDNAAAARTHSVLASEGRDVVVAFILPG